jgi:hypothetical protein
MNQDEVLRLINENFGYLASKGFQMVNVEVPSSVFWAVDFQREIHIRVDWYVRDGISIMITKPGISVAEYWKWYVVETLVYFLTSKEVVLQFYEKMQTEKSNYFHIETYSNFLSTYLDKIIELVASDQFEKQVPLLKQAYQALLELQMQRIKSKVSK